MAKTTIISSKIPMKYSLSSMLSLLIIASHFIQLSSNLTINNNNCQTSDDCDPDQCCIETPMGRKMCLDYEKQGELCFYHFRTPTCGCAKGLKCVSTSPMQPGDWNHDYICSRVRPFQYHKLLPYFNDNDDEGDEYDVKRVRDEFNANQLK